MTAARPRHGVTLVELLVAATLAAIVTAAAASIVARQARGFAALATGARVVAQADAAVDVASLARWASPADLRTVADSLLELRAFVGAAPVCAATATSIDVEAPGSASASWLTIPRAGDLLLADDGDPVDTAAHPIAAVATAACGARPAYRLTLASSTLLTPATVHLLRDTRFLLYPSADGLWYLGMSERDSAAWSTIQPVSGPFAAPAAAAVAGLHFASLGTTPAAARALRVSAHAIDDARSTAHAVGALTSTVALRNAAIP